MGWSGSFQRPFSTKNELRATLLERVREIVFGVIFGELHILYNDPVIKLGVACILVDGLEGDGAKEWAGLNGRSLFTIDDRVKGIFFAINRGDDYVFAGMLASGFEGGNCADRHFVVVGVDGGYVGMCLQEGRHDFTTGVAVEVAVL